MSMPSRKIEPSTTMRFGITSTPIARAWLGRMSEALSVITRTLPGAPRFGRAEVEPRDPAIFGRLFTHGARHPRGVLRADQPIAHGWCRLYTLLVGWRDAITWWHTCLIRRNGLKAGAAPSPGSPPERSWHRL